MLVWNMVFLPYCSTVDHDLLTLNLYISLGIFSRLQIDNIFVIIPRYMIVAGYYGFTLDVRAFVRPSIFHFWIIT